MLNDQLYFQLHTTKLYMQRNTFFIRTSFQYIHASKIIKSIFYLSGQINKRKKTLTTRHIDVF